VNSTRQCLRIYEDPAEDVISKAVKIDLGFVQCFPTAILHWSTRSEEGVAGMNHTVLYNKVDDTIDYDGTFAGYIRRATGFITLFWVVL
jgi:hypothetical protein